MAGCISKTSPKEAKTEAGELGRAGGRAVPHHSPGTSQRAAGRAVHLLGATMVARLGDLLDGSDSNVFAFDT